MSIDVHANNLVDLFEAVATRFPDRPIFGAKTGPGQFAWMTYEEVGDQVDRTRAGLALLGNVRDRDKSSRSEAVTSRPSHRGLMV